MRPIFPFFKRIELNDRDIIDNFIRQFPPYNDFEFTSLWTYNSEGNNSFTFLDNNLVIKIHDFITGEMFYSFMGKYKIRETISILLDKSRENGYGSQLKLIPQTTVEIDPTIVNDFLVEEDLDNFDYILSVEELAAFIGSKYYDKRNLVNRFKRMCPEYNVQLLDLHNVRIRQEMLDVFLLWEKQKGHDKKETEIEVGAFDRFFHLVAEMDMQGIGVYDGSRLVGFSTFHRVHDNYAIMTFEKGDTSYKGVYALLNNETAKYLRKLGVTYINFEQDLGIPSLKKAKMLWRPIFFLKKYIIEDKR